MFSMNAQKTRHSIRSVTKAYRNREQSFRRAELSYGATSMTAANDLAVRRALELAGVEFIDENGGGPGVRLRNRQKPKQPK
jgi:hypothetical protein